MKDEEILKKAIENAVGNGWITSKVWQNDGNTKLWANEMYRDIIFSHSFAKAFWGEPLLFGDVIYVEMKLMQ
ncbi:hypothetical protein LCGC14_0788920 [marine sediment metagenome]|uniref:Uncharacterized protein n=1 Tax=marine sediment metagenome TaxID=412755 RepID=A0A0F9SD73_9ZZZZ